MSIEFKPFHFEAEVQLTDDFGLKLNIDFAVINRLEALLGKGMDELLGELNSVLSTMVKFAWGMTRKHHPDLDLDQITGLVLSPEHGQAICATLGNLVRHAFNIGDGGEGEQSSRPPRRSGGASRGSARSGSPQASIRKASGAKRRARS